MEKCEQCGNPYNKCFVVEMDGQRHLFDSFECAIFAMAPACGHCGCRVLGHGAEGDNGVVYCCDHCMREHSNAMVGRTDGGTLDRPYAA